jgi:GNAT superfamily N-acetyltransferase
MAVEAPEASKMLPAARPSHIAQVALVPVARAGQVIQFDRPDAVAEAVRCVAMAALLTLAAGRPGASAGRPGVSVAARQPLRLSVWEGATAVLRGSSLAYLADVYVVPDYQGRGLGKRLVQVMIEEGPGVAFRLLLHTADAHELYQRFGFAARTRC